MSSERSDRARNKISRIETGLSGLRIDDVAAMLGLYHVRAGRREEILDLVRIHGRNSGRP